ncbi:glutathione S-transferase family protein [Ectothiorhodospiraceae bacterium 2226]|nr:glutathione S-transferase family protein [Ectothiorhodospiraceae bacterium 2226]
MDTLHIYSIAVCPFAQRTRILLRLKDIPFELHELDLTRPSDPDFLALNPSGQVPVIVHQGKVLNESSVINEYLEDVFPAPPVFPSDPYKKAVARALIAYCNEQFIPAMYTLLMNQNPARDAQLTDQALETWARVDALLMRHNPEGTWLWDDSGFGMAELSYATFFQRYCLNAYYRGFELPNEERYARVRRWRDAMLPHPLVRETGMSDEDYIKLYYDYALGYGNGAVPPGRDRSSFDLSVPLAQRPMPSPDRPQPLPREL